MMFVYFLIAFISLWFITLLYIGIFDLIKALGGTFIFFILLPLFASLSLKLKQLAPILWSLITIFIGLILTNYLHSYISLHQIHFDVYTGILLTILPSSAVIFGTILMIQYFFKLPSITQYKHPDDKNMVIYFGGFLYLAISILLGITIPLIILLDASINYGLGYEIALCVIFLIITYFAFEFRKISIETINYFAQPFKKFKIDTNEANRYLVKYTLMIILASGIFEIYREQWIIWAESTLIIVVVTILLMKFWRVLYLPEQPQNWRPNDIYLPSIKSRKTILILILVILFAFICAIIE